MQVHSTAASKPAFKPRVRRLAPGRYLVESQSRPGTGHPVTADYCPCKGFSYRGTCRHTTLVAALEPSMHQWYGQAEAPVVVPMSAGAPSGIVRPVRGGQVAGPMTDAAQRLAQAYRALADAHEQSDERAVLLRRVDELERQVAADNASAMRAA